MKETIIEGLFCCFQLVCILPTSSKVSVSYPKMALKSCMILPYMFRNRNIGSNDLMTPHSLEVLK